MTTENNSRPINNDNFDVHEDVKSEQQIVRTATHLMND